ncbi:MAG: IS1634 family transposase [Euryarchaeota archaeon]|nr:IS1634 family transposase [Euryarchaeota archaeon]
MKPFTRVKKINGIDYVYEITPYYDPDSKTTKQRSKYLGKLVDGETKRMRKALPRNAYDYGTLLPSFRVIDELGLDKMLEQLLPNDKARAVLALAVNRVVAPVAVSNANAWYEKTIMSRLWGELPLSSQTLSDFLAALGGSSIPEQFTELLLDKVGRTGPLLYDITSFSSSSKLLELLEYGHNRDGDDLPQMNMSIIAHKTLGIPLGFQMYPGSIADVSTIRNTVARLRSLGLDAPVLIMDRGFYSLSNLTDIIDAGYDFIIPTPMRLDEAKTIISKSHAELEDPTYLRMLEKETLFVKEVSLKLGELDVAGYLFYDLKREQEERSSFYEWLDQTKAKLEARDIRPWQNPARVFEEEAGALAQYFGWKLDGRKFVIEVKKKAVSARLNRAGKMIVLHSGQHSWQECLTWSRERDVIEKMFRDLKGALDVAPLRSHKVDVVKGTIFVNFIALIIRSRLLALMRESKLCRKHSLPSVMLELSKIHRIEMVDGSYITSEVTRTQRKIVEALDLDLDRLCA